MSFELNTSLQAYTLSTVIPSLSDEDLGSMFSLLSLKEVQRLKKCVKYEETHAREDIIITIFNYEPGHEGYCTEEQELASKFFMKYGIDEPYEGHPLSVIVDVLFSNETKHEIYYIKKGEVLPKICTVFYDKQGNKTKYGRTILSYARYNDKSHTEKLSPLVRERPDHLFRDLLTYAEKKGYKLNIEYAESVLPQEGPYRLRD